MIRTISVLVLACLLTVGCAATAGVNVGSFDAGVDGSLHAWQDLGVSFDCNDEDPPCRSSVTLGFVTGGSHITLGGSNPNSVNLNLGVSLGE